MVSFFRDKWASSIFWLIMLSIGIHAHFIKDAPEVITVQRDGLLYFLLEPLKGLPGIARVLIYHFVILIIAIRLNYILNDLKMMQAQAFTTGMTYVMLSALFKQWSNITEPLIMHIIILWLYSKLARLYNNNNPKTLIYNIGLIAGLMMLLYYPAAILVALCFFALLILRPFSLNELITMILGIITPCYFLAIALFLTDHLDDMGSYLPQVHFASLNFYHETIYWVNLGIIIILVLAGFSIWQRQTGRMLIQARKNWGVLLLLFILIIPILFINSNEWISVAFLSVIPVAAFGSNVFLYPRKNLVPSILFWLLTVVIVFNNWFA
ncbi:MAG: hypothetical protein JWN76_395 [Chitinophagaceae bacterium]|nr:hypothetical protein [Chitinophagaceae bacterium]